MTTLDTSVLGRYVKYLSPSSIDTWITCPTRWMYRYVRKIKTPPSGAMFLGTSVHAAIEANHVQKVASQTDLASDELEDRFAHAFDHPKEDVDWTGEKRSDAKDDGGAMVRAYARETAPSIQPAVVEQSVLIPLRSASGPLPPLMTRLDLVDTSHIITDFKTKSKAPDPDDANASGQLTAYEVAHRSAFREPSAGQRLIHYTRPLKKNPRLARVFEQPTTRSDEQIGTYLRHARAVAVQIAVSVQTGDFPLADPKSWACSASWCGYFQVCPGGQARRTSVVSGDPLATWRKEADRVAGGSAPTKDGALGKATAEESQEARP